MTATNEHRFSVLITDDDPGCRLSMQDIIERAGYQTLLAGTGEEALEIVAENQQVHVVLMDMNLPRISGLDALKILHQWRSQLPCILMSANATAELVRQAFQAHAYSVIPKPVNQNVVLYTVVQAIKRVYGPPPGGPGHMQQKAS
jgi:two-component system, response regulator PdtaR